MFEGIWVTYNELYLPVAPLYVQNEKIQVPQ